jgi:LCP family protein required for cell wall assembly
MKKFFKVLFIILIILLLIIGSVAVFLVNKLNKINYVEISKEEIEVNTGVEENLSGYRNIALFGIDTRDDTYEGSRSDCIMIASINHDTKEIKIVSVYRDTYLNIPGRGLDKVNHAYAYGGPVLSMSTLNTNLDLDITEFATVNFTSTKDIINAIGGVTLTVTDAEAKSIPRISSGGTYLLDGEQALAYGRIRKIDNDYKRTERMRTVVMAVFEKAKTMSITELNKLANQLLPEIYTNISATEILALIPKIYSYSIVESQGWPYETRGITLGGVWYGPPVNLAKNVAELHKTLFGKTEYVPTETVQEISNNIINKTGYR